VKQYDPFSFAEQLRETYIRYLLDAHLIHESQRTLREQFEQALRREDMFVREPLVSLIPAYEHGLKPSELFGRSTAPRLHPRLRSLSPAFDPERPLYTHQVKAIERIQRGRNTVVATGTGSGKTECFLLPILDDVVRRQAEGVRAILVYPMNALANDQLERMRGLVGDTAVTFGRYTGQTPWTEDDVPPEMAKQAARPNEKLTRAEIRQQPPDILLTNFAMLEYLLLRPQDQDIFGHRSVRYVVLDEAHSYSGAQGIDIGLLMRRFQRLFPHQLQFILTSATLGDPDDPAARRGIAEFASGLCGSEVGEDDIVFADTTSPFEPAELQELAPETIAALASNGDPDTVAAALADAGATRAWLEDCRLSAGKGEAPRAILHDVLRKLQPVHAIYEVLRERPATVPELASAIFQDPGSDELAVTQSLLTMASMAKPNFAHSGPLLSVRVHHFFRGLVGANAELRPDGDGVRVERVYLEDREVAEDNSRSVLPLRTCVHCGLPVVAVDVEGDQWRKPSRVSRNIRLLTWMDLRVTGDGEEDPDQALPRYAYLSLGGRQYTEEERPDGEDVIRLSVIECHDRLGNLARCPNCDGRATPMPSVLREFVTGEDAPTALLAEELVRALPEERASSPAGGRRLLAFSDSRQRAAYFVPYLTRTVCEPWYVQPLVKAAAEFERSWGDPPSPREVIEKAQQLAAEGPWIVLREAEEDGFEYYNLVSRNELTRVQRRQLTTELAITLYQHLVARSAQRSKVFGLMLLARDIQLEPADLESAARFAPSLFVNPQIGRDAICRLLLYLVQRRAVEFWPESVNAASLLRGEVGPTMVTVHRNATDSNIQGRQRFRWNPYEAPPNRRNRAIRESRTAQIVASALSACGRDAEHEVQETLNGLWEWLISDEGPLRLWQAGEYRLPLDRILVRSHADWYRCSSCGSPTIHPMDGGCELFGCTGRLVEVRDVEQELRNRHLAGRYRRDPLPLNVREHTAQLTLARGREYQDAFLAGDLNVLSSSTTFELGVDVGSLQAVLLRNVPPTAANYIQRAGRAGRRRDGVAHAVTFVRSVPHDQHHYFLPLDIVAGRVSIPVIYTANPRLTQRHVNSFLLGRFLFDARDSIGDDRLRISDFFPEDVTASEAPVDGFAAWCEGNRADLLQAIGGIIPADCQHLLTPEDALATSVRSLFSRDAGQIEETVYYVGQLRPLKSYEDQRAELGDELDAARDAERMGQVRQLATALDRVDRLRRQLLETRLIDFLASNHWLPSYAFPQDSVQLLVRYAEEAGTMRLERDRELGISEYAPGAEIIADGKLLTSAGINLARREPQLEWFSVDDRTRTIAIKPTAEEAQLADGRAPIKFVQPIGFTTLWNVRPQQPNLFRLRPPSNTEVFLQDGAPDEDFEPCPSLQGVTAGIRPDGKLFRANLGPRGQGFRLCLRCGLAIPFGGRLPREHRTPWGARCTGRFDCVALAHVFDTDVMQIRFHGHDSPSVYETPFWTTLTTALRNSGCELLHIDPADLDTTYRSRSADDDRGEIVLYDRVPGGAGHVQRIRDHMREVLESTLNLLENCPNPECHTESSCYACLRSHRNQFTWPSLRRSAPVSFLRRVITAGRT